MPKKKNVKKKKKPLVIEDLEELDSEAESGVDIVEPESDEDESEGIRGSIVEMIKKKKSEKSLS